MGGISPALFFFLSWNIVNNILHGSGLKIL